MTDELITTDHPLSAHERRKLTALADTLVPASDDGRMISAGELDVAAYITAEAMELLPVLQDLLGQLEAGFDELALEERVARVQRLSEQNPEAFQGLIVQVYACYYQDDRVLSGIGLDAGPPFPRGNTVEAGDLSLLDPVVSRNKTYRR